MPVSYADFLTRVRLIHRLRGAMGLLSWDQEVCLPEAGAASRAGHRAALATVIHEKTCDPGLGDLVEELAVKTLPAADAADVREFKRERDRALRLPAVLVAELAEAAGLAQADWVRARDRDDWALFAPHLERLVALKRREADAIGYAQEPYDALLDEYEPDARVATLLPLFARLRAGLTDLLSRLESVAPPAACPLAGDYPVDRQDALGRRVLAAIGYDFAAGRLDISPHPFTEAMGAGDVRVTTRWDPRDLMPGLYACLHEGGHALYEQGLPAGRREQPSGQAASLGLHESQSRLWENHLGRSRAFCAWLLPDLRETFGQSFAHCDADSLYRAVNAVRRSLVRIEADEVTYNLHIILRLEIERALLRGDLRPADVPAAWRQRMRDDLGVEPAGDSDGALQDIHWSSGAFGYFPTYTLGNLYAAQFDARLRADLPDVDGLISRGEFAPLLAWLRDRIHGVGAVLRPAEICRRVTGVDLSCGPFLDYLERKYSEIYGLRRASTRGPGAT